MCACGLEDTLVNIKMYTNTNMHVDIFQCASEYTWKPRVQCARICIFTFFSVFRFVFRLSSGPLARYILFPCLSPPSPPPLSLSLALSRSLSFSLSLSLPLALYLSHVHTHIHTQKHFSEQTHTHTHVHMYSATAAGELASMSLAVRTRRAHS